MNEEMTKSEEQHLSLQKALQQCELVQNMIDISISSLEGLRTKCATSNDLTQKEIRTLEVSATNLCLASSSESIRRAVTVCWFLSRPRCIFPYILLIYDKAAFLLPELPLHKRAGGFCLNPPRDHRWVQGHKSGELRGCSGLLETGAFCRWRWEKVALLHQSEAYTAGPCLQSITEPAACASVPASLLRKESRLLNPWQNSRLIGPPGIP